MSTSIQTEYYKFLKQLAVFTICVLLIALSLRSLAAWQVQPLYVSLLVAFFGILSAVLHRVLLNVSAKRPAQFVNTFMGITGLKLFLLFGVVILLLATASDELPKTPLIILFCGLYVGYTSFEIINLLRALDRMGK